MRWFWLRFSVRFSRHRSAYGLRRLCFYYIRFSCDLFMNYSGTGRDKSVRRLHGDCTEAARFQCCHRTVSVRFSFGERFNKKCTIVARSSCGLCVGIVRCQYDISTSYGLTMFKACITFFKQNGRGCDARKSVRYRTAVAIAARRPYRKGVTGSL